MKPRYTKHQVARGARADAETNAKIYLIKNVDRLCLTYQIRLLAVKAIETKKKLILKVPIGCRFDAELNQFMKQNKSAITREVL